MAVKLFHDRISKEDGAGPKDLTRNLLNTSGMANATDVAGPACCHRLSHANIRNQSHVPVKKTKTHNTCKH